MIPIGYQQGVMVRKKQNKISFGALHEVTPSKYSILEIITLTLHQASAYFGNALFLGYYPKHNMKTLIVGER
jgi:hypothetical protein